MRQHDWFLTSMKWLPLTALVLVLNTVPAAGDTGLQELTGDWSRAMAWYDGKAECAVYDATRDVYGKSRRYQAHLYTNKERYDPKTTTKTSRGGREVFKHHLREDIPTDNYTYHYSTMCYVATDDMSAVKLDMGSQEDCGATFKQFVRQADQLDWRQFSYFPDEGARQGRVELTDRFAFQDSLSLVLRGYPFDDPPSSLRLELLADQTTNKWSPTQPRSVEVRYVGRETLDLPIGKVQAHHLRVADSHDYWFAADSGGPWRNVMVRYEGPGGQTYALRELKRCAYWRN